jgi:putative ABC transport system permease protein
MAWYKEVRSSVDSLIHRTTQEHEMDEEMRFHIEMETQRNLGAGMAPDEARRRAMRDFGGVDRHKEGVRDERGSRWVEDLGQDMRYAWRTLRRRIGFTTVASLTLALGIGATTVLFGVVKAVLLAPLPYRNAESIAVVWSAWKGFDQTWLSYDEWEAWRAEIPAIADIALFSDGAATLTGSGDPERLRAGFVMENTFRILGVEPMIGRGFTAEEDRPNGPRVVVLGHALWQRRFGGDAAIVGKEVQIGGRNSTVVGVMPAGFKLPLDFGVDGPTELWMPLATDAAQNGATPGPEFPPGGGGSHGYYSVARLKPGTTAAIATAQLHERVARYVKDGVFPPNSTFHAFAVPVQEQVTGRVKPALLVVFAAVGLVLLIACANVAGLMLVRGEARRRELAVRVALGAGTKRLTRQLLTESVVLAGIGGVLGLALAAGGVALVRRVAPANLPRIGETSLDPMVLLFALVIAMCAALLTGVLPALQASNVAPGTELKEGGRGATVGATRLRWRQALVSIEVALAVVLVVGAGLMVRSVANLFAIDPGFNAERVLTMRLSTPSTWYTDSIMVTTFHTELQRRVRAIPGVESAAAVRILPLATEMGDWGLQVEGYTPPPNTGTPGDWQVVTPGYFETMGLRLVKGRFLDDRDQMNAPLAMVVNRQFVESYLPKQEPLGKRVRIFNGSPDSLTRFTIVGVVENVHHNALTADVKPQFYATLPQFAVMPGNTSRSMTLVVKARTDPNALIRPVRAAIREMDPRLPVSEIRTMEDVVGESIAEPRFTMQLLGVFGVLSLVLSAIGIFGIVSQVVASRSHEFGIRSALGASPKDLVMLSVKAGVKQTIVGLVIGVGAALAFTRLMAKLLHGVTPTDPLTFTSVVVVTAVVAIAATIGPARRAGRTDPVVVLHDS